ncbi:NADPH-dependent FMN reductase [Sphingomonas crocodyli]|uniref:NAD(P)H-dependent oxidoreductase n=1 Tax=Sphingomonas crocodyli TaxID=1979270 RepID=A0A437M930_9SPHN|nr:NADPH-dependent FMN reductase [Sphingomonas crocodyli]RVT94202.1 NAD(P)H-dependent oxidoreductase [Sphingomonas crocodyli]
MAITIGLLVGSARAGSYNQLLADRIAAALTAGGATVWTPDGSAIDLPIFHADREREGFPEAAETLKRGLAACQGLVLISPEYNGSVSPLIKNLIDWASRSTLGEPPLTLAAFKGKPVLLASASIGPFAGVRAIGHLREIAQAIQLIALPEEIRVGAATTAFDTDGNLTNPATAGQIDAVAARLIDIAGRLSA